MLLRDDVRGLQALMVRRSSELAFAGGMWVFPGGRVDPGDSVPGEAGGAMAAVRRAAVREVAEESNLVVDASELVPFSHWTPPAGVNKRFSTWFFVARAPAGAVVVDGGEIKDHAWMVPNEAIESRDAGEIGLVPPTWVTLWALARHRDVGGVLAAARGTRPEAFSTHVAVVDGGAVALYAGDEAYDDPGGVDRPGPRHRLWMLDSGWRYERSG